MLFLCGRARSVGPLLGILVVVVAVAVRLDGAGAVQQGPRQSAGQSVAGRRLLAVLGTTPARRRVHRFQLLAGADLAEQIRARCEAAAALRRLHRLHQSPRGGNVAKAKSSTTDSEVEKNEKFYLLRIES